ncbi:hypothetical protein AB0N73_07765 [Microbacterium sp. NPDC089189]|uniref:hypothetical protein n=1 Tax=Microbacterium sp. NPDC089189 TaxID=3154972 RepID=UPI0034146345
MSAQRPDPYRPENLRATLAAARRIAIVGAWASIGFLIVVLAVELVLPIDRAVAVRDGVGLALVVVGSWGILAVANALTRRYPAAGSAFGTVVGLMIGFGGGALVLTLVLDAVLAAGVLAIAVPAAIVLCIVLPGVYVAFAARAMRGLPPRG